MDVLLGDIVPDAFQASSFARLAEQSRHAGLDALAIVGWETIDPPKHEELMNALSVIFSLVGACVDEDLEFDFLADFFAILEASILNLVTCHRLWNATKSPYATAENCGNVMGVADIQERIGDVQSRMQDLAGAFESYRQALLGRDAIHDFRGVGRSMWKIAEVLDHSGQRVEAIEFLCGAITQVLTKHGEATDCTPAYERIGRFYASDTASFSSNGKRIITVSITSFLGTSVRPEWWPRVWAGAARFS